MLQSEHTLTNTLNRLEFFRGFRGADIVRVLLNVKVYSLAGNTRRPET